MKYTETMQDIPEKDLMKKGAMTTPPWEMNLADRIKWELEKQEEAKKHLFSIGQPIVYKQNGETIAEFADGSKKRLR